MAVHGRERGIVQNGPGSTGTCDLMRDILCDLGIAKPHEIIMHRDALAEGLMHRAAQDIGVFTASPGMGKSFALRCFAAGLNPGLYHMEYICLSTVSVMEFYVLRKITDLHF